ncbi:hypothetical protein D3C78_806410 [compost metagenome]
MGTKTGAGGTPTGDRLGSSGLDQRGQVVALPPSGSAGRSRAFHGEGPGGRLALVRLGGRPGHRRAAGGRRRGTAGLRGDLATTGRVRVDSRALAGCFCLILIMCLATGNGRGEDERPIGRAFGGRQLHIRGNACPQHFGSLHCFPTGPTNMEFTAAVRLKTAKPAAATGSWLLQHHD